MIGDLHPSQLKHAVGKDFERTTALNMRQAGKLACEMFRRVWTLHACEATLKEYGFPSSVLLLHFT